MKKAKVIKAKWFKNIKTTTGKLTPESLKKGMDAMWKQEPQPKAYPPFPRSNHGK